MFWFRECRRFEKDGMNCVRDKDTLDVISNRWQMLRRVKSPTRPGPFPRLATYSLFAAIGRTFVSQTGGLEPRGEGTGMYVVVIEEPVQQVGVLRGNELDRPGHGDDETRSMFLLLFPLPTHFVLLFERYDSALFSSRVTGSGVGDADSPPVQSRRSDSRCFRVPVRAVRAGHASGSGSFLSPTHCGPNGLLESLAQCRARRRVGR
jgi:hypothetical protein